MGRGLGVWDFHGGRVDVSCALFQMSHSTQVKRRRMWQRSEFWVPLVGVRWRPVNLGDQDISGRSHVSALPTDRGWKSDLP